MKRFLLMILAVALAYGVSGQDKAALPGFLQLSALSDKSLLTRINVNDSLIEVTPDNERLLRQIAEKSLTVVRRDANLPLRKFKNSAFLAFNADSNTKYIADKLAEKGVEVFLIPEGTPNEDIYNLRYKLNGYDKIVVSFHAGDSLLASGALHPAASPDPYQFKMFASLGVRHGNIGVYFGNPSDLDAFTRDLKDFDVLIVGYEDTRYNCEAAAKIILGEIKPSGILPIDTEHFRKGTSK